MKLLKPEKYAKGKVVIIKPKEEATFTGFQKSQKAKFNNLVAVIIDVELERNQVTVRHFGSSNLYVSLEKYDLYKAKKVATAEQILALKQLYAHHLAVIQKESEIKRMQRELSQFKTSIYDTSKSQVHLFNLSAENVTHLLRTFQDDPDLTYDNTYAISGVGDIIITSRYFEKLSIEDSRQYLMIEEDGVVFRNYEKTIEELCSKINNDLINKKREAVEEIIKGTGVEFERFEDDIQLDSEDIFNPYIMPTKKFIFRVEQNKYNFAEMQKLFEEVCKIVNN